MSMLLLIIYAYLIYKLTYWFRLVGCILNHYIVFDEKIFSDSKWWLNLKYPSQKESIKARLDILENSLWMYVLREIYYIGAKGQIFFNNSPGCPKANL